MSADFSLQNTAMNMHHPHQSQPQQNHMQHHQQQHPQYHAMSQMAAQHYNPAIGLHDHHHLMFPNQG